MALFVLMTRLAPEAVHDARGRRDRGKQWMKRIHATCPEVKWLAHYALLGPYDFMDIYEAPDSEMAHRVSMISRAGGALTAESWPAVSYDRFLELLDDVVPEDS